MSSLANVEEPNNLGEQMSLMEHLEELRSRLVKSSIAVLICTVVSLMFTSTILQILIQPYGQKIIAIEPTEAIVVYFRVALTSGFILAAPFVFYQLLMFIMPGLEANEKKYIFIALPIATLLFLIGISFAWFLMIPTAIGFLSSWETDIFVTEWRSNAYIPFVTSLIFWIGVSFELPLVIFFMAKVGWVTPEFLIRQWQFAVVIAAIAAAMITPTVDPINMFIVMVPLLILYGISILFSYLA